MRGAASRGAGAIDVQVQDAVSFVPRGASGEVADLWIRFKMKGERNARDDIIRRYAYLVKITAGRVVTSLPPNLERDDLVSAGVVGLIRAVDQFDTSRNVKFETYAIALIRGAILEMLREQDWVPRSVRERMKNLERSYRDLEHRLGRVPNEEEIARALDVPVDDYHGLLRDLSRAVQVSLDDLLVGGEAGEKLPLYDTVKDDSASPSQEAEYADMRRTLADCIGRLPERERMSIALYYYEGLTFKEIGKVLNVSESRVYQLHTQAVMRLRGYLARDMALFH
jgi:RNA polymerase sigma factor for flagellar operon FliA